MLPSLLCYSGSDMTLHCQCKRAVHSLESFSTRFVVLMLRRMQTSPGNASVAKSYISTSVFFFSSPSEGLLCLLAILQFKQYLFCTVTRKSTQKSSICTLCLLANPLFNCITGCPNMFWLKMLSNIYSYFFSFIFILVIMSHNS